MKSSRRTKAAELPGKIYFKWRVGVLGILILILSGCGPGHPQVLFEKALQEEQQGKLAVAQKLYRQVLAKDPNHIGALEHYGTLLLRLNERAEAARQFRRVIALIPNRKQSVIPLAQLYLEEHRSSEVEELLRPWQGHRTAPVEIRFIQADLAFQKDDKSSAQKILQTIAKNGPKAYACRAKIKLSALAQLDRQWGEAEKFLKEVLASDPQNAQALIGWGNLLLAEGKPKEATTQYIKAWIDPQKPPLAAVGIILCAIKDGDLKSATLIAKELSERYPAELNYAILLAELAVVSNQPDALASLQLSDKAGAVKQYVDGLKHFADQQYYDAYPLLTSVAKEWVDYGPAQLFAGQLAVQINDQVQALEFLKNAEQKLPPDPQISALLARVALAQSQPDLALAQLSKVLNSDSRVLSLRVEVAFRQGQYEKALVEAEKWKTIDSGSPWAEVTIADIKYALNQPAEAKDLWKKVASSGDGPAQTWAAFRLALAEQNWVGAKAALDRLSGVVDRSALALLRGQVELDRGSVDEARSCFDSAKIEDERNASAYSWLGVWKVLERQMASAHEDFQKALELNPEDPLAHWGEGFIALLDKRYVEAKESFEKSLRANPAFDLSRLMLAQTLLAQEKSEEALKVLEQCGPLIKDTMPAMDLRGRALILTHQWDRALEVWEAFKTKYPKSSVPYFYKAQIQFLQGKKDAARDTIEAGLKVVADDARLLLARADMLWNENKRDESLLIVTQLAKGNKNIEAVLLQGMMHLKYQHYSKATSIFKDLLTANPDEARLYSLLYEAQVGLGKTEDAALTLRTGWLRLPNQAVLGLKLAALHEKNKNWDEAISTYREILKVQPDHVVALNQLAWLLAEQKGDIEEALKLADQAFRAEPKNLAVADTRAWILYLKGNVQEAQKALAELVQLVPDNAYVCYHWGLALWKTGDRSGAKAALQKALTLEPNFSEKDKIKQILQQI